MRYPSLNSMNQSEMLNIVIAIAVLAIVIGLAPMIALDPYGMVLALAFAIIIIGTNILSKVLMALNLDAKVEHSIWQWSRYGFKESEKLAKSIPMGIILPLAFSVISLGALKVMTILTYETSALKRRAARRHGHMSFTEITDWHNALIGGAGIIAVLLVSFISYWIPGFEGLSRAAAFYAFFNMLPVSKLDGAQIFFGSRVLWYTLGIITLIFTGYALLLV